MLWKSFTGTYEIWCFAAHQGKIRWVITWVTYLFLPVAASLCVSVTGRGLRCLASLVCTQSACDYCPLRASRAEMRLSTKQPHLHRFCREPLRFLRSALEDGQSGRRLVCVTLGNICISRDACTKRALRVRGGAQTWNLLMWMGGLGELFEAVRPNLSNYYHGAATRFIFCRWFTKSPYLSICYKLFLCVCWFVYLFLYFVVMCFCWTQLLGPHHAERPNMAPSVNRSPGATRQKTGENHPAKFSARWLPAGIVWGPQWFFFSSSSLSVFPAWWAGWKAQAQQCCCWHNHSGTPGTALLAWHLLLSRQKESEQERKESKRSLAWQRERVKLNCNFGAVTVVRAGNSAEDWSLPPLFSLMQFITNAGSE